MITIPKKSFFEGKTKYINKIAAAFEDQVGMDPINAHYAAHYWHNNKKTAPEVVVTAFNKLIAVGGDVSNPYNVKVVIEKLQGKK